MLTWSRLTTSRLLVVLLATLALLAFACGDDGDADATVATPAGTAAGDTTASTDSTAAATGAGTEAAATSPEASGEPIQLGFSAWPGWFPWQVAEEAGIFEEAGVNVELVWFEGYLDSINALAAGQLDANSQTLNDTIASVAAGSDQVIVLDERQLDAATTRSSLPRASSPSKDLER